MNVWRCNGKIRQLMNETEMNENKRKIKKKKRGAYKINETL